MTKTLEAQLRPLFARIVEMVQAEVMPLAMRAAKAELLGMLTDAGRGKAVNATEPAVTKRVARRLAERDAAPPEPRPVAARKASPSRSTGKRATMRCRKCGELGFRSDGCGRTHNTAGAKVKAPASDDEDSGAQLRRVAGTDVEHIPGLDAAIAVAEPPVIRRGRPPRLSASAEEPRVLSLAAVTAMLVADRSATSGGDAGGFVGRQDREASLVGVVHGIDRRETCALHGWVGRHRFEQDRHDLCPAPVVVAYELEAASRNDPTTDAGDRDLISPEAAARDVIVEGRRWRSRPRRSRPRSDTLAVKNMSRAFLHAGRDELAAIGALDLLAVLDATRPKTRGDCLDAARPCPFVGCSKHLYLDINPETGSIKFNFPELEPEDMRHSCVLDAADLGPHTLEAVGEKLNVTRERLRQIEVRALLKLKGEAPELREEVR